MSDKSWHQSHCFKSYGPNDFTCERPYAHGGDCGPVTHKPPQGIDAALAAFTEWFVTNYPGPDTIIFNPTWHAPKIFRAVETALLAAPPDPRKDLAALEESDSMMKARAWLEKHKKNGWSAYDLYSLIRMIEPRTEVEYKCGAKASFGSPPDNCPVHGSDCKSALEELVAQWRKQAEESLLESSRIRRTIGHLTEAGTNCVVRAELWKRNADELEQRLAEIRGAKR